MSAAIEKSSKNRGIRHFFRRFWKRILILIILFGVGFFVYKRVTSTPAGVEISRVYKTSFEKDFTANGQVKARNMADLKFYSPGKVAWINVARGDSVNEGQSVASLDAVSLNSLYQQSLNNIRNYQAIAENVYDEVQGHTSDETYAMRATRTTAEVNRDNAWDSMLAAKANLDNAIVISPITGTVLNINNLTRGLNISGSDIESKFIRVVDLTSLYFEAQVDEIDYSDVRIGQEVRVDIDAFPSESCTGVVGYIGRYGQETAGGVITIPVEVNFSNCNLNLAVNLNGQASFVLTKYEGVLTIPKKYILNENGEDFVWKQTGETVKDRKKVAIKTANTSDTEAVVVDGLVEGDKVIFIP